MTPRKPGILVFATIGSGGVQNNPPRRPGWHRTGLRIEARRDAALPLHWAGLGVAEHSLQKPEQPFIESAASCASRTGAVAFRASVYRANTTTRHLQSLYEYVAHVLGTLEIPGRGGGQGRVRAGRGRGSLLGSQAFIHPILVMRKARLGFRCWWVARIDVVGTTPDPSHGIEQYQTAGSYCRGRRGARLPCACRPDVDIVGGPRGSALAFEPFPQNYYQVEAQAQLNKLPHLQLDARRCPETRSTAKVSIPVR